MAKRKWRTLRYRKKDLGHNVLVAVSRWIRANNGTAVVIGGIGIRDYGNFRYEVVISATGQKPVKAEEKNANESQI